MSKGATIGLISFLSLLVLGLIALFVLLLTGVIDLGSFSITRGYSENKVEEKILDSIEDLKIDTNTADMFIEYSEDGKVLVELYSEDPKSHSIKLDGNNLNVELTEKNHVFGWFRKQSKIVVKLPKEYANKIVIDSTTGDLKIDSYENATLEVKERTGDVEGGDLKKVEIEITTGDIELKTVKTANIKVTTGDVEIDKLDDAYIKSTTGDIKLGTVNNKIEIEVTTGDIDIDKAIITEDSNIKSTTGDVTINSLENAYVESATKTGDNKVNNNDRKAEKVIKITTTTGDIRVN